MQDAKKHIRGYVFGPGSSRRIEAEVQYRYGRPAVVDMDGEMIVEGHPLRRDKAPGGLDLLMFEGGFRFETKEFDKVDQMFGLADDDWLHKAERWGPGLAVVVGFVFVGLFVLWKWGIDILVAVAVWVTPPAFVEAIDDGNLKAMDQFMTKPTTLPEERQAELRVIFEQIVAAAPQSPYGDYELHFRSAPRIGPNAFALPGGTVVMTDDMVRAFGNDDLLAGVLGHELAHVHEKHGLSQLYRSVSVYLLVALIAGDVGPILEDVLLEGGVLLSLSHSRKHERQADRIGIETARQAGFEPAALADFFEQLLEDYGDLGASWYSTHPSSKERVDAIRKQAREGLPAFQ